MEATTIFAVGGRTAEEAKARARYIADYYKANDFLLDTPLGDQEALWWAMQPGTPMTRQVRELAQLTTGREFASGLPLVSSGLGDDRGIRLGDNITTGRHTPILLDLFGNIRADSSASFGVVCELGGGKSTLLKGIGGDVVDRGGVIVALDRTVSREYATFAASITGKKTIVADMLVPEWSLDPLRVWGVRKGARMVQSLFAVMLNVEPLDVRGIELSGLLEEKYMERHGIDSLGSLMRHLEQIAPESAVASELYKVVKVVASKDLGRVLFDESLPALDLGADAIIFTTACALTFPIGQRSSRDTCTRSSSWRRSSAGRCTRCSRI